MELHEIEHYCESPIEKMLASAMAAVFADFEEAGIVLTACPPMEYQSITPMPEGGVSFLIPQAKFTGIDLHEDWTVRLDFLLICGRRPGTRRLFAIECDGHEWHEKTKKQVARDKLRDRRLILEGITPIRFSGSEIHASAAECAEYIRQLAHSATGDALGEQHVRDRLNSLDPPQPTTGGFKRVKPT